MTRIGFFLVALSLFVPPARAAGPSSFEPDPYSVQRHGPAYRYPQAGWIVLHVEGEPYERGYQHGRLLSSEIAAFVRCFAAERGPKAPAEGWRQTRTLANALFLRRYDKEYLEEMKGIADGASAGGARFDGRPLDLVDVVALNSWAEIETLDGALEATPTGLEGTRFNKEQPKAMPSPKAEHCSAFAATGPATRDGKIVFGHITMFGLYPSNFFNVWIDVKPAKGHRVFMQTYPGGIQSGMDYYFNDAGLMVCETTIRQTRFHAEGLSLSSRIRRALQYADSIDRAVEILKKDNNGLYTNEWLLGDAKTNEIAMFELGTHKSKLFRSGKSEWFGGTEGFYWGCNNTKDLEVRLETLASVEDRPADVTFRPSERDKTWLKLYDRYKGKIDADFGKVAFTTPPVAAYHSLDAKFTTTDMVKELKTWALFGPPLGRTWQPTQEERRLYPEIRPLASNPWTVLHAGPPAKTRELVAADLGRPDDKKDTADDDRPSTPAWRGTLLPAGDADLWLTSAFSAYEHLVSQEKAGRGAAARERLGLALFARRADYQLGARALADVPLDRTRAELRQDHWHRVAAGKGVLALHTLRQRLGDAAFADAMDGFGRAHAGKPATAERFREHLEKTTGKPLGDFFGYWARKPGLPSLRLGRVAVTPNGDGFVVEGEVECDAPAAGLSAEVVAEAGKDEARQVVRLDAPRTAFRVETKARPRRVVVDRNGLAAKANGGAFAVTTFRAELDGTLIVYGTGDEVPTNREAAEALQRAVVEQGSNVTVPVKSDREVSEEEMKSRHLILVGRPDSNALVERFRSALPVTFGSRSFAVNGSTCAHADSAVIAAAENPSNRRYSVVTVSGLSAAATLRAVPEVLRGRGEVVVLANGTGPRALVVPAKELVREFPESKDTTGAR